MEEWNELKKKKKKNKKNKNKKKEEKEEMIPNEMIENFKNMKLQTIKFREEKKEIDPSSELELGKMLQVSDKWDVDYNILPFEEMIKKGDTYPPLNGKAAVILDFLIPVFDQLKKIKVNPQTISYGLQFAIEIFKNYAEKNQDKKEKLMQELSTDRLLVPVISLHLPASFIKEYNRLDAEDPRVSFYYHHPVFGSMIQIFGLFLDRFDTQKSVICLLVWSSYDNCLFPLANINLKPYPLCWNGSVDGTRGCQTFGTKSCAKCGVAKYCSRECQLQDWPKHKEICSIWSERLKLCEILSL